MRLDRRSPNNVGILVELDQRRRRKTHRLDLIDQYQVTIRIQVSSFNLGFQQAEKSEGTLGLGHRLIFRDEPSMDLVTVHIDKVGR